MPQTGVELTLVNQIVVTEQVASTSFPEQHTSVLGSKKLSKALALMIRLSACSCVEQTC